MVLIGGSGGVGKSTVAHALTQRIGFAHHIATGAIREVLRSCLSPTAYPALFHYTFRPPPHSDLLQTFEKQSAIVCQAVSACITRAYAEGTDTVVEGNHLVPALLQHIKPPTRFVMLHAPPEQIARRLLGSTHRNRRICSDEVERIIQTQEFLVAQARVYGIPVITNHDITTTVDAILCED